MPLFSLKGKTAIISGAGAGIGLAVARGFAEAGANVVIWYYSNKKALTRADEIEKEFGVKCTLTPIDLHIHPTPTGPELTKTTQLQARPTRSMYKTPKLSKKP
jgi:NAD(P)-dependent dehydrogenase (short-subunit alcohol dehydrogenase family)